MKTVLCYGDSITWGFKPEDGTRYGFEERWTGILQSELGPGFRVVEEGLSGRTTCWDSPYLADRNGKATLPLALETHSPIDIFVLMLGTNDLWTRFNFSAPDIAASCMSLAWTALRSMCGPGAGAPEIVLVAPPHLGTLSPYMGLFFSGRQAESKKLGGELEKIAQLLGCKFLDAGKVVKPSRADGVHLDAEANRKLGLAVAEVISGKSAGTGKPARKRN